MVKSPQKVVSFFAGVVVLVLLIQCKTTKPTTSTNVPNYSLNDCYHFGYSNNNGVVENYITNRLYLSFSTLDSSFRWEVSPTDTEGLVYYTEGHYSQNKNQILFKPTALSKKMILQVADLSDFEVAALKNRILYLPVETDTVWIKKEKEEFLLHDLYLDTIDKVVYYDSIFLEKYQAFVSPETHLAPIVDNYKYLAKEYATMTRPIRVKAIPLEGTDISIAIKINGMKSDWFKLKNGDQRQYVEALFPFELKQPIIAKLKEDSLSTYDLYKIQSRLCFDSINTLGERRGPNTFFLYADSCTRNLKKTYVNSK